MTKQEQANVNYLEFLNGKVTPFNVVLINSNGVELWPFIKNMNTIYGDFKWRSWENDSTALIYYSAFLKAKYPDLSRNNFNSLIYFYKLFCKWLEKNNYELDLIFIHFKNEEFNYYFYAPNFKEFSRIKFFLKNKGEFNLIDEELTLFLQKLEQVEND